MATKIERRGVYLFIEGKEIKNDIKSIEKEFYQLRGELRKAEIGSEAYNQKLQKMGALKNIMDDHNKAVRDTGKQWNLLNSGTLGKIKDSFENLPGPIGTAISSVTGLGTALWALVANPIGATIAVIVGSLTLLYKAFTSTDTGAVALEGTFKSLGNIVDVLWDRTMSYYKMLGSLFTLDWQGFKKNATDAFGGIGSSMRDAASAGWEYAQTMDSIADRESASLIRTNKMKAEIEELKNLSKDSNKTAEEKMALAQKAMDMEIELNAIEKGFLKERNEAELKNLASKIQIGKLTMDQKEEQLKQWLEVDDKELESMMEKDAAFREFVNKNEEEFQNLQKAKAEEFQKDQEFFKETRRLQKTLSSEKKEILQQEEEARKQHFQNLQDEIDKAFLEEQNKLKEQYLDKKLTQEQLNLEMYALEAAHLVALKALHEQYGLDTTEIDAKIIDQKIQNLEAANQQIQEMMKIAAEVEKSINEGSAQAEAELMKETDEWRKQDNDKREAALQKEISDNQKKIDEAEKLKELQVQNAVESGIAAIENAETLEEAGRAILNSIRDQIKAYIAEAVTIAALKALKSVPFPLNLIAATVAGGAAMLLFNKLIPKFEAGGYTNGARMYMAGEAGTEWIAPNDMVTDPIIGPRIAELENIRRGNVSISKEALKTFTPGISVKRYEMSESNNKTISDGYYAFSNLNQLLSATEKALSENTKATYQFMKWQPKVYTEMIKKDFDTLDEIDKKR